MPFDPRNGAIVPLPNEGQNCWVNASLQFLEVMYKEQPIIMQNLRKHQEAVDPIVVPLKRGLQVFELRKSVQEKAAELERVRQQHQQQPRPWTVPQTEANENHIRRLEQDMQYLTITLDRIQRDHEDISPPEVVRCSEAEVRNRLRAHVREDAADLIEAHQVYSWAQGQQQENGLPLQQQGRQIDAPNTQKLRLWLAEQNLPTAVSPYAGVPDDAAIAVERFLDLAKYGISYATNRVKKKDKTSVSGKQDEAMIKLEFLPEMREQNGTILFNTIFDHYFNYKTEEGDQLARTLLNKPDSLVIQLKRFYQEYPSPRIKIGNPVIMPMEISRDGMCYELRALIHHSGASLNGGHYTEFLAHKGEQGKITGTCANDGRVYPVSAEQFEQAKDTGYIYYYVKKGSVEKVDEKSVFREEKREEKYPPSEEKKA